MAQRVPRTRAGRQWTEARYWQFIRSGLRMMWNKYPAKHAYKKKRQIRVEGETWRYEYMCEGCGLQFRDHAIQVDHIEPAGSLTCYEDLPGFVERLFCEEDNLQILCGGCHAEKTKGERDGRKGKPKKAGRRQKARRKLGED